MLHHSLLAAAGNIEPIEPGGVLVMHEDFQGAFGPIDGRAVSPVPPATGDTWTDMDVFPGANFQLVGPGGGYAYLNTTGPSLERAIVDCGKHNIHAVIQVYSNSTGAAADNIDAIRASADITSRVRSIIEHDNNNFSMTEIQPGGGGASVVVGGFNPQEFTPFTIVMTTLGSLYRLVIKDSSGEIFQDLTLSNPTSFTNILLSVRTNSRIYDLKVYTAADIDYAVDGITI